MGEAGWMVLQVECWAEADWEFDIGFEVVRDVVAAFVHSWTQESGNHLEAVEQSMLEEEPDHKTETGPPANVEEQYYSASLLVGEVGRRRSWREQLAWHMDFLRQLEVGGDRIEEQCSLAEERPALARRNIDEGEGHWMEDGTVAEAGRDHVLELEQ